MYIIEIQTTSITNTAYDDVFRTLLNDCASLIIPVVNEIFGTDYSLNEEVILHNNELFLNGQAGKQTERITDSNIGLRNTRYHIECQSSTDGTILIRIFEYDSQIALQNSVLKDNVLTVKFPNTAILYLRHNKNTAKKMTVVIEASGTSCSCAVPVMKVQEYSIDEIFEKQLLFLIPFHIFSYEKNFKEYDSDEEKLEQLKQVYVSLVSRLDECVKRGEISEYVKVTIMDMSKKVLRQIAKKYSKVEEGVGEVMGGKILDYEAKDILNAGIRQGMTQGMTQGKIESILETLEELGSIPQTLQERIMCENNLQVLKKWFRMAVKAESMEEFLANMESQ